MRRWALSLERCCQSIVLCCLLPGGLAAAAAPLATVPLATIADIPDPRRIDGGHVADPDDIVGAEQAGQLDLMLRSIEQRTGVQVAVVALETIGEQDVLCLRPGVVRHLGHRRQGAR